MHTSAFGGLPPLRYYYGIDVLLISIHQRFSPTKVKHNTTNFVNAYITLRKVVEQHKRTINLNENKLGDYATEFLSKSPPVN